MAKIEHFSTIMALNRRITMPGSNNKGKSCIALAYFTGLVNGDLDSFPGIS